MTISVKTVKTLLDRLGGPFREFGVRLGALYLLDRALRLISTRCGAYPYAFVVQPIPDKPWLPPALAKNGRAERLAADSAWLLESGLPGAEANTRFARGDGGIAVLRKEQFVGYAWWATQTYFEQEVQCAFEWGGLGPAVFDFDVYIKPEHRMGIGFMSVWDALAAELRRVGVAHTYSRISRFNLASMRAHARLGARILGHVTFVRLGGVTLAFGPQAWWPRLVRVGARDLRLRLCLEGLAWV